MGIKGFWGILMGFLGFGSDLIFMLFFFFIFSGFSVFFWWGGGGN